MVYAGWGMRFSPANWAALVAANSAEQAPAPAPAPATTQVDSDDVVVVEAGASTGKTVTTLSTALRGLIRRSPDLSPEQALPALKRSAVLVPDPQGSVRFASGGQILVVNGEAVVCDLSADELREAMQRCIVDEDPIYTQARGAEDDLTRRLAQEFHSGLGNRAQRREAARQAKRAQRRRGGR